MLGRHFRYKLLLGLLINFTTVLCFEKGSLTFVIDDTISMDFIIDQVKHATKGIMDMTLLKNNSQIEDMVLVTFKDTSQLLKVSKNKTQIYDSLNSIVASDGGTCPEGSMGAVKYSLEISRPSSTLYVFTDDFPNDFNENARHIKELCEQKQSTVTFIIGKNSNCWELYEEQYPNLISQGLKRYDEIATSCSGNLIVANKDELRKVLNDISVRDGNMREIFRKKVDPSHVTIETFTVNIKTEYVLVSISGNARDLIVKKFGGYLSRDLIKYIVWTNTYKTIQINNPALGKYIVKVKGHSTITIKIEARTEFLFEHGFSQQLPNNILDTTKQPIGDTKNYLLINVTDPADAVNIKNAEIYTLDKKLVRLMVLQKISKTFYKTEKFKLPNDTFNIAVTGTVKSTNRNIIQFARVPVNVQHPEPVIPDKKPEAYIKEGKSLTVEYGSDVILTCKVSGYPKPNVIWKDGKEKIRGQDSFLTMVPYDYTSFLKLHHVTKSDVYKCHAENKLSTSERAIDVQVESPFKVLEKPPEQSSVPYGSTHKIICNIVSRFPMKINWYHQRNDGSKTLVKTSKTVVISNDGRNLEIKQMDFDNTGKFTCEATLVENKQELVTFKTDLSVIGDKPIIDKVVTKVNVLIKETTKISCKITQGFPKPHITWYRKRLVDTEFTLLKSGNQELDLPQVELTDGGTYRCIALNEFGTDRSDTELIINYPPTIITDKTEFQGTVGDKNIKIPCKVIGHPAPRVLWDLDGKQLASGKNYLIQADGLLIKELQENNNIMNLKCEAVNEHGKSSKMFKVTIKNKPTIDKTIKEITVLVDQPTKINCKFTAGNPKPYITWYRRSKNSEQIKMQEVGEQLYLPNVKLSDAGIFSCVAQNEIGTDRLDVQLIVDSPPIIIADQTEFEVLVGDEYLNIPCKVIGQPVPSVSWSLNGHELDIAGKNYTIQEDGLVIKDLQENINLNLKCKAVNKYGTDSKQFNVSISSILGNNTYGNITHLHYEKEKLPKLIKLECPLAHENQKSVKWFSDSVKINHTGSYLEYSTDEEINFKNFTCRVTDEKSSLSQTFVIHVDLAPRFKYEKSEIIWTGEISEEVSCAVQGRPKPTVEWFYNNKSLDFDDKYLQSIPIMGFGNHRCRASNMHGTVQRDLEVTANDCLLNSLKGLSPRNPLVIHPRIDGKSPWWYKYNQDFSFIVVNADEKFILACPGTKEKPNYFKDYPYLSQVELTCVNADNALLNDVPYKISQFTCGQDINANVIKTEKKCFANNDIDVLKIGFQTNEFLEVYEVCYDSKRKMALNAVANTDSWSSDMAVWDMKWSHYPGFRNPRDRVYTCENSSSTGCYAKTQLLSFNEVLNGVAQSSTFIDSINAIPEWRSSEIEKRGWEHVKEEIKRVKLSFDMTITSGVSFTKNSGSIPKFLWKLLKREDGEKEIAFVYVNDPSPVQEDIRCKEPCDSTIYDSLNLNYTDPFTYCCNLVEFKKNFTPDSMTGYID